MATEILGGCAGGVVRYATQAVPKFTITRHCRQCQRVSGSGYAAQFAVAVDATNISGEIRFYETVASSGNTVGSGFCQQCGSLILKKTTKAPPPQS